MSGLDFKRGTNWQFVLQNLMFNRKANLPEEELRELYVNQGLTMTEIAERFGVGASSVRRRLDEMGVVSRARGPKGSRILPHHELTEADLREMYLEQKLSIPQIAEMSGWGRETVRLRMIEYGIPIRSFSAAHVVQHGTYDEFRDFDGDTVERSYMLGFRLGDLHVRYQHEHSEVIRLACTSSKPEQIALIETVYGRYGHVMRGVDWRVSLRGLLKCEKIEISLNQSFDFLLEHPDEIHPWILADHHIFLSFLAGFTDAEGSFHVTTRKGAIPHGRFSLKNTDKRILEQCREKLISLDIACSNMNKVYDEGRQTSKRGVFANKALWEFSIEQKESLLRLIDLISPYLLHGKRRRDMNRVRENVEWRNSDEFEQQTRRKRAGKIEE